MSWQRKGIGDGLEIVNVGGSKQGMPVMKILSRGGASDGGAGVGYGFIESYPAQLPSGSHASDGEDCQGPED